jgi:thioredoxin reductase (NADPH)
VTNDEAGGRLRAEQAMAGAAPVILLVDADLVALESARASITRRFGVDYYVTVASSYEDGLRALRDTVVSGRSVALVAADCDLPAAGGVSFLEAAYGIDKRATRILLIAMDEHQTKVPLGRLSLVQEATALGRIDAAWVKGWDTPEDWLYPQLQESLTAWTRLNRPRHLVYQVVGEQWAPRSHHVREFLSRNSVPFWFYDVDTDEGRLLIERHGVDTTRLPALIHRGGTVLQDPDEADVAAVHGISTRPSFGQYDLVVVGAGPAGLASAVYGASEGLRTLVVESQAIGGQAGTSSMIRNYLGFPRGVSGGQLAHRAWEQAVLLGAEFAFTHAACAVRAAGEVRELTLSDGSSVGARAVIIATGVNYRRMPIPALERLTGVGVFYGAAGVEASALSGQPVAVIGGANSAGQAALHLARYASHVTLLVRGPSLKKSMSQYLIEEIRATANITVRLGTQVVDAHGDTRLEGLVMEDIDSRRREELLAHGLFVLIGAEPRTEWLPNIRHDNHGFLLTGPDADGDGAPLDRRPFPFETSLTGVFAAGDVRHGSVRRVAGAVGEGSVAVGAVHQYLATLRPEMATRLTPPSST